MAIQPFKLLFVCTGNIARSPLAEACARHYLSSNGDGDGALEIGSAGTHAVVGDPPRAEVLETASGLGIDLSAHRARQLTPELLERHDLVLPMAWEQVAHIWSLVPEAWEKCFTVKEFVHWAKQAPSTPPILFPDRSERMRDKVRQTHSVRKRARADQGFWGGLRPEDLNVLEPDGKGDRAWTVLGLGLRALAVDSIRLVGGA